MKDFIALLVKSVGGQGGDTLKELITHALHYARWQAVSSAKVGLAQRGGSVAAYLEASRGPALYSPHASPGFVDIVIGLEGFEMLTAAQEGLIDPQKTIAVMNTSRVYLTQEKTPAGDGILDSQKILDDIIRSSRKHFAINASAICRLHGLSPIAQNIILFATLPEFPELGISEEACRYALEELGKNSTQNTEVFSLARRMISSGEYARYRDQEEPDALGKISDDTRKKIDYDARRSLPLNTTEFSLRDPILNEIYNEATGRIWNYQKNMGYVVRYRRRIERAAYALLCRLEDNRPIQMREVFEKIMRHVGTMMVYHDAPYVAGLKLRRDRIAWVKNELNSSRNEPVRITESFRPDLMEIVGLLPHRLVDTLSRMPLLKRYVREDASSISLSVRSDTITGATVMRLLRIFEPLRLRSWRYRRENSMIEAYLSAIEQNFKRPVEDLSIIADAPRIIRGYGKTRARTSAAFYRFLNECIPQARSHEELSGHLTAFLKD